MGLRGRHRQRRLIALAVAVTLGLPLAAARGAPPTVTGIAAGPVTDLAARGPREQFFGGGMQNGRFSHREQTIKVAVSYDWDDGGNPNSVPFYASTAGYGVLRNTVAPGSYTFAAPVLAGHEERRFDAYYF